MKSGAIFLGLIAGLLLRAPSLIADPALPSRPADALTGTEFARRIEQREMPDREREIVEQVLDGNVPDFWRRFVPVSIKALIDQHEASLVIHVAPDYLAVGSDADYLYTPLSPEAAQTLANRLNCLLPTPKLVDEIHRVAIRDGIRLDPIRIPPSPAMTTAPVFAEHSRKVREKRDPLLSQFPLGILVSGTKKDVVISQKLSEVPGKVAIYGWIQEDGTPIQSLYTGHTSRWVDYSHGIRLISRKAMLDDQEIDLSDALRDNRLHPFLSDEGPLASTAYPVWTPATPAERPARSEDLTLHPAVRCRLDLPDTSPWEQGTRTHLVIYALPNGNTIEQTAGRRIEPGEDWHYEIQHIRAQTEWLRANAPESNLAVGYLEAEGKSWPAWRKKYGDKPIRQIVEKLSQRFRPGGVRITLTGHSGGGSFTFGYLEGSETIPDEVERIAFLDSNYAFDETRGHGRKLTDWLRGSSDRYLCVLAYDDARALLNSKPFVSASGGTWGRTQAMLASLSTEFKFTKATDSSFQRYEALSGRITLLMKENPARAVLHTRQVERNGFIHAFLSSTPLSEKGYTYFGPRIYEPWISSEELQ